MKLPELTPEAVADHQPLQRRRSFKDINSGSGKQRNDKSRKPAGKLIPLT